MKAKSAPLSVKTSQANTYGGRRDDQVVHAGHCPPLTLPGTQTRVLHRSSPIELEYRQYEHKLCDEAAPHWCTLGAGGQTHAFMAFRCGNPTKSDISAARQKTCEIGSALAVRSDENACIDYNSHREAAAGAPARMSAKSFSNCAASTVMCMVGPEGRDQHIDIRHCHLHFSTGTLS
jgi:hypothetical protein